ncbi:hypothetical protein [Phaeodactylibacter sp.]|uniref:hypothetical protein n=1 Tax=Phaeodactylibacter sp. TaxID=1940289 RepID=UPI0025FD07EA|nr:hypothetical protein [Phaeodactylibacter sp.]MCI4649534.1 hypothetical protein [Phaeodactylibacter sp.]MCI5090693.1 hypothetical protein [Phaeodactylibacter sp.]
MTFIRACQHITNYTAGHETRSTLLGEARVAYPDQHIEADNRLSWMLGKLGKKYGKDAFYVHLKRDVEATAASYNRRWAMPSSIVNGYTECVLLRPREQGVAFCIDYVHTVNDNIDVFLEDKPHKLTLQLEDIESGFKTFWQAIGAEGSLTEALETLRVRSNPSRKASLKDRLRFWVRQF